MPILELRITYVLGGQRFAEGSFLALFGGETSTPVPPTTTTLKLSTVRRRCIYIYH